MDKKGDDCIRVLPGVLGSNSHVELAKTSHGLTFRTCGHDGITWVDIDAARLVGWIVGPGRGVLAEHGVTEAMDHRQALIRAEVAGNALPKIRAERDDALTRLADAEAEVARLKAEMTAGSRGGEASDGEVAGVDLRVKLREIWKALGEPSSDIAPGMSAYDAMVVAARLLREDVAKATAACVTAGFSVDTVTRTGIAGIVQTLDAMRNGWEADSKRFADTIGVIGAELDGIVLADSVRSAIRKLKQEAKYGAAERAEHERVVFSRWDSLVEATGAERSTATWDSMIADVRSTFSGARDINQATQDLVGVLQVELAGAITAETARTAIRTLKREARDAAADRDQAHTKATSLQVFRERVCTAFKGVGHDEAISVAAMLWAFRSKVCEELRCGMNIAEAVDKITRLKETAARLGSEHASALATERAAHAETKRQWNDLLSGVSEALIEAGFMPRSGGSCVEAIRRAAEMKKTAWAAHADIEAKVARLETELNLAAADGIDHEIEDGKATHAATALHAALEVDDMDWSHKRSLAFVYQIIAGWPREMLDDLAERYGWGQETVERLVELHEAFGTLLHGTDLS